MPSPLVLSTAFGFLVPCSLFSTAFGFFVPSPRLLSFTATLPKTAQVAAEATVMAEMGEAWETAATAVSEAVAAMGEMYI